MIQKVTTVIFCLMLFPASTFAIIVSPSEDIGQSDIKPKDSTYHTLSHQTQPAHHIYKLPKPSNPFSHPVIKNFGFPREIPYSIVKVPQPVMNSYPFSIPVPYSYGLTVPIVHPYGVAPFFHSMTYLTTVILEKLVPNKVPVHYESKVPYPVFQPYPVSIVENIYHYNQPKTYY